MFLSSANRRAVALSLSCYWLTCALGPSVALAAPVEIPNGMPVELSFLTTLSPESAVVGETVILHVTTDVTVQGAVVIAQGATAQAEIVTSEKQGSIGKPAEIQVILRSVQAVDGTSIPLTGQKAVAGENKQTSALVIALLCCILGLLQKGGEASVPAGSTVRGMVIGPVTVEA